MENKKAQCLWASCVPEATAGFEPAHRGFADPGRLHLIPSFALTAIPTKGHVSWPVIRRQFLIRLPVRQSIDISNKLVNILQRFNPERKLH